MEIASVIWWLVFIWFALLGAGGASDWKRLKAELNGSNSHWVVERIVEEWGDRPLDFFRDVSESAWRMIIPLLSDFKIGHIRPGEFRLSGAACKVFAKHLSKLSNREELSDEFCLEVYNLLIKEETSSADVIGIIQSIPSLWVEKHGTLFMQALVQMAPPGLGHLSRDALSVLLGESSRACDLISLEALQSLSESDLGLVSPSCIKFVLGGLERMDLSPIVENLRRDIFSEYNGPLTKETIEKLTAEQVQHYGSSLANGDERICTVLDLHYLSAFAASGITANCLYGYLGGNSYREIGLGELWRAVSIDEIHKFTSKMRLSWKNIPVKDFDSMTMEISRAILPKVCPVVESHFWSRERIRCISGRCLHQLLLAKHETPLKLGTLWRYVPIGSVYIFIRRAGFSWNYINQDDHKLFRTRVKLVIYNYPKVCASLDISFWKSIETAEYVTEDCLYEILGGAKEPVALGELWGWIPESTIKSFEVWRLYLMGNIAGSDFQHVPSDLLNLIFSLSRGVEFLPQPRRSVILSSHASDVWVNPWDFPDIVEAAPNVAGQLLWYSENLPYDVLSNCGGRQIRSLEFVIPGQVELDWRALFAKLEERHLAARTMQLFSRMIQSISNEVDDHFCSTLKSFEEYLSLPWLRRSLSSDCQLALGFQVNDIFQMAKVPELVIGDIPWKKMLEQYNESDWALFSASSRVCILLGGDCNFWGAIDSGSWPKVLAALDRVIFQNIIPNCVLSLGNTLRQNFEMVRLLADNAFSKHRVNQLPCRLQDLSPEQIAHLSSRIAKDKQRPTSKEICQHVLSTATLDDVIALNLEQFKSLYKYQWVFLPKGIKGPVLSWWVSLAQSQVQAAMAKLEAGKEESRRDPDYKAEHFKAAEDALRLVLKMHRDSGYEAISRSDLFLFVPFARNSSLRETFTGILERSSALKTGMIGLIRSAGELRSYVRRAFNKMSNNQGTLVLSHDCQSGFDRSVVIKALNEFPRTFAAVNAKVVGGAFVDAGGPIRALMDQLVNDLRRDLVVPCVRGGGLLYPGHAGREEESDDEAGADRMEIEAAASGKDCRESPIASMMEVDGTRAKSGNAKFVWGISKEVGYMVGLVFGKALQLDIRLPFALDQSFYRLLIDASDNSIEKYYSDVYRQEIYCLKRGIMDLANAGKLEELLQILPRVGSLRFTRLSTRADPEEARNDVMAKTNLWGCGEADCYENVKELGDGDFMKNYIGTILGETLCEFKGFIRKLIEGLGTTLPPVSQFKGLPPSILEPFAEFVPELLNSKPLRGEDILARVRFKGDRLVPSLVRERKVAASRVFSSFILTLREEELVHLIGVWTGSSTLALEYSELGVIFMPPGSISSYQVDFCEPAIKGGSPMIRGAEYQKFFKEFAHNLLGCTVEAAPDCSQGAVAIVPGRVSTCAKSLMIYLQPSEQMLTALVDLLETRPTTLWDNQ